DSNPSQILGSLNANGYVILQNSAGFYVGGQAAIRAHGLVMTTASAPALNLGSGGPWAFSAPPPTAKIINYGTINIDGGGSAFVIADDIENHGTISAPGGNVGLYAGEEVLVSMAPDGRGLSAKVTLPQGSVDNEGRLAADGGSIALQAQMVNQDGVIQADSAKDVNGTIELLASKSVSLGASSDISANGDSMATSPSAGGSVTIKAGESFADTAGSAISVAGGARGGDGGRVEICAPEMGAINSVVSGQAADGFSGGNLTIDPVNVWLASANTDPGAQSGYTVLNVNNYSGMAIINVQADDNIALNTIWSLPDEFALTKPASLTLSAGKNIIFESGSGIRAGKNWNVSLNAGTSFVAGQPKPASGSYGIYLDGNAYLQAQDGKISLTAANEVQVGWSGTAATTGSANSGTGYINTLNGGEIDVTATYGDVNTGSGSSGFQYLATAPYFEPSPTVGGISTVAGGNVNITAGGNVVSFPADLKFVDSSGNTTVSPADPGTGAFGSEAGNVTINAGGSVYGNFVLVNGVGTINAVGDIGSPDSPA
ncbi:MAG: hypothetical protein KGR98_14830, partial [Verrucomicrobia bacterium]|nr:hypothetical protein [Verrucomicrobiota bacterium]